MRAKIRDTELYFDVEGAGLVIDGSRFRSQPATFLVHGGPGADHTSYKPSFSPLSRKLQLIYFDHRGLVVQKSIFARKKKRQPWRTQSAGLTWLACDAKHKQGGFDTREMG